MTELTQQVHKNTLFHVSNTLTWKTLMLLILLTFKFISYHSGSIKAFHNFSICSLKASCRELLNRWILVFTYLILVFEFQFRKEISHRFKIVCTNCCKPKSSCEFLPKWKYERRRRIKLSNFHIITFVAYFSEFFTFMFVLLKC